MFPEVLALVAKPYSLIVILVAVLAVGVFIGMTTEQLFSRMRRRAWRERNPSLWARKPERTNAGRDASDQLRIVMGADFTTRPVLNKGEARVFRELDRIV